MNDAHATIEKLQKLIYEQEAEIAQLKELQFEELPRLQIALKLQPLEYRLLQFLMRREFVRKDAIMSALYFDRHEREWPTEKTADICLMKLRRKLKPADVEIKTKWAEGIYIDEENKQKLRAFESSMKVSAA